MMVLAKDPSSTIDYSFDWSGWLCPGEAILETVWSLSPEGAQLGDTIDNEYGIRGVPVSGGELGVRYRLSCAITTNHSRKESRSATIRVIETANCPPKEKQ